MTESEAIKLIKERIERIESDFPDLIEYKEALEMSAKALENQFKKENADSCVGCAFEDIEEWEMPCRKCKRGCKDYWRAKKGSNEE